MGLSLCILPPRLMFTMWTCAMFTKHFRKRGGVVTQATKRFVEGLPVETVAEAIYSVSENSLALTQQAGRGTAHLAGGTFARIGDTTWRRRARTASDASAGAGGARRGSHVFHAGGVTALGMPAALHAATR